YCSQSEVFFTYERTCTTWFRSDPQARRIRRTFSMERRNSFSNVSDMTAPLAGSVDAWPETNSKFPTLVAGLKGRCVLDTSGGTGYSMRVMSPQCDAAGGAMSIMVRIGLMGCGTVAGYGHLPAIV